VEKCFAKFINTMSRIGKQPVNIPDGVEVENDGFECDQTREIRKKVREIMEY